MSLPTRISNQKPPAGSPVDWSHPLAAGLRLAMVFGEGAGNLAADAGPFMNPGSLVNGAGWGAGLAGIAGVFDGTNDYADLGDRAHYTFPSGGLSVVARIKRDRAANAIDDLINKDSGSGTAREYNLGFYSDSKFYWFLVDANASPTGYIGRTAPAFGSGAWHDVACTYDGGGANSGVRIYDNAARIDNANYSGGAFTQMRDTSQPLYLGRTSAAFGAYFQGRIEHVYIYGRELSALDAAWLHIQPYDLFLPPRPTRSYSIPIPNLILTGSTGFGDPVTTAGLGDSVALAGIGDGITRSGGKA